MRNEQARLRANLLGLLFIVFSAFIVGCRTCPASVDTNKTDTLQTEIAQTQTDLTATGKDTENTITIIKTITDDAKDSGEIPKEKVVTLIKYIDQSAAQIKAHNEIIAGLNKQITAYNKSRISDNLSASLIIADKENKYHAEKNKASGLLKWALIASFIALVLACILWLPKLLKFII